MFSNTVQPCQRTTSLTATKPLYDDHFSWPERYSWGFVYVADAVMVIAENPTNLGYPSVRNKKKFGCPYAKCRATKPLKLVALMTAWLPIQIDPT